MLFVLSSIKISLIDKNKDDYDTRRKDKDRRKDRRCLQIITEADEGDLLYDDIGCGLKIRQMQMEKRDLLESLEMYYKVFVLGEEI